MQKKKDESYPIKLTDDVFAEDNTTLIDVLKSIGKDKARMMIVADSNVVNRTEGLGLKIGRYLRAHELTLAAAPVIVGGGEKAKNDNFSSVKMMLDALVKAKIGRNDIVIAIGGGAVLDAISFTTAQVRCGLDVLRIPTTVAAMLGGAYATYGALDGFDVKDSLRLAASPAAVIVDRQFLRTILDGVWRGGLGEAIRLGTVRDASILKQIIADGEALKNRDLDAFGRLAELVVAVRQKKGGSNFAEWAALRAAAMSGYKLPHGYAIGISVVLECSYAVACGMMKDKDFDLVIEALSACGALEGLLHSRYVLSQPDSLLRGLDAWRLVYGSEAIELPAGAGKSKIVECPDHELYRKVMADMSMKFGGRRSNAAAGESRTPAQ